VANGLAGVDKSLLKRRKRGWGGRGVGWVGGGGEVGGGGGGGFGGGGGVFWGGGGVIIAAKLISTWTTRKKRELRLKCNYLHPAVLWGVGRGFWF